MKGDFQMFQVNGIYMVRAEKCTDCNQEFYISLDEFIHKTESRMNLPKRCSNCRRKRRKKSNPYAGLFSTMHQYPATKGHRHKIHGGR